MCRGGLKPPEALDLVCHTEGEIDIVTEVRPVDADEVERSQYAKLVTAEARRVAADLDSALGVRTQVNIGQAGEWDTALLDQSARAADVPPFEIHRVFVNEGASPELERPWSELRQQTSPAELQAEPQQLRTGGVQCEQRSLVCARAGRGDPVGTGRGRAAIGRAILLAQLQRSDCQTPAPCVSPC